MATNNRLLSLDVLRGLTVAGMILVNNGNGDTFSMLLHSEWNGLTPCDLVFPFFLFIMGVSCYLSLSKGLFAPTQQTIRRILKRTVLLFLIGLFINWFAMALWDQTLDVSHLRLWAVLQRIALCYFFVSMFALFVNHRYTIPVTLALLAVYAVILLAGNGYSQDPTENILARVDTYLFGKDHLYRYSPIDPEGLLGTISGVAHTLIGFYCGKLIKSSAGIEQTMCRLFAVGTASILSGYLLSYLLPLNKCIWSPSYALVTCGLGASLLALIMFLIDYHTCPPYRYRFFLVFGMNALALYVASELFAVIFGWSGLSTMYYDTLSSFIPYARLTSLAYALTMVLFIFAIGYLLYRKRIFIKL